VTEARVRILHVLGERGFSGGEVQLEYLLDHLVARGHDNLLVLQPGAQFARVAGRLAIPVTQVRMRSGQDPLAWLAVRRTVRRLRPELVHLACSRAHWVTAFACLGMPRPVRVVTRRMDYPLRHRRLSRWLYGRAVHAAVAISAAVRREITTVGVPEAQVHLIHEGVPPEAFAEVRQRREQARARLGIAPDRLVVLCAASLRPRKGQIHLVRAFAAVRREVPAALLVLAGEGSERQALAALAERLGLGESVLLPGRVPTLDCLAVADIACIPSLLEGLSVFSLEAMAAGLPVVASAVGGLTESVADGVTGLLVPPASPAELQTALLQLLRDPALRARMGAAGPERVRQRFSARGMAEKTETLYEVLLAKAPRS
jgi:glycosyltransferase involved in cell wall biosynthesis